MCFKNGKPAFLISVTLLNTLQIYFQQLNNKLFLVYITLFAIIIRAFGVSPINLSIEEAEFFYYSHPTISTAELLVLCERGLPVFDFLLYKTWFSVVGFSVIKGKALSFLFNVLLIPVVYLLSKKTKSTEGEARFSAFLVVVALGFISLANIPRFYNEVLLFSALSFYFFLDFLKPKTPILNIVLYVVFTSLTILSHYFFLFVFVSQGLIIGWFFIKKEILKPSFIVACVGFFCVAIVLAIVLSTFVYLVKSGNQYLTESNNPLVVFGHLYIFLGQDPLLFIICIALLVAFFIHVFKTKQSISLSKKVILFWLLLTFVIPVLVDMCYKPIIRRDYHLILFIPFLMLVSWGFELAPTKWKTGIVVVIILSGVVNICFIQKYYTNPTNTLYQTPLRFGDLSFKISQKYKNTPALIYTEQEIPYNLYFKHIWNTTIKATSDTSKINYNSDTIIYVIKHKEKTPFDDEITNNKIVTNYVMQDSLSALNDVFRVYKIRP